jgi:ABC-type spermidine/putrescine transport system permease subunit I
MSGHEHQSGVGEDTATGRWLRLRRTVLRSPRLVGAVQRISDRDRLLAAWQAGAGVLWMVVFLFAPLAYILALSFWQRGTGGVVVQQFSWENYRAILLTDVTLLKWQIENVYLLILWQSLKFGFVTTVVTLLVGYVPGYFLGRTETRWRSLLLLFVVLPFWVPLIIRYYAWILVVGNQGVVTTVLGAVGLSSSGFLYSDVAVVTGLVQVLLPFMILPIYNSVNKIDASMIESAKTMGASPLRAFFEVSLPLSLPGITAGSILVFILAVGSFMAPALLGGPENIMVANLITRTFGELFDWPLASAMAIVYLLVLFALITTFNRFVGLEEVFQ